MKATLNLDERLWTRLKATAAKQKTTMSSLVELAIRRFLRGATTRSAKLPPLPRFDGGGTTVDVANRDELYRTMECR